MISNNYIPEKINEYNAYLDGTKMIGVAASVTLPEVNMKTSTVTGGSIKVAEDERGFIIGDLGAVAARGLAIAGKHIKQLVLKHKVNELRRFGRKFLVHLLAGRQNFIRGAL